MTDEELQKVLENTTRQLERFSNKEDAFKNARFLRNLEDKLLEEAPKPEGEERTLIAKGGLVEVPQAPEEPDERIDKMTGIPYNIQAGGAFIDEEDRENILK